jgi:hypothetical protein
MALVDNAWYVNYGNGSSTGYYAVTAWSNKTAVAGEIIRQATTPSVGNERCFVCIVAGATGSTEPTWAVTRGAKNTSSSAVYQECTGVAALNGDVTNTPNWTTVKNTSVSLGQVIKRDNEASFQICTTAGTAGNGSEPSFSDTAGTTTTDNTVTWTSIGVVGNFTGWQAPHARLGNAFTSTWGTAGNSFFVASEHAETKSSTSTLNTPGTLGSPCFIYCVTKTAVPPASANLTTGATISTTGATDIVLGGISAYYRGITFSCGSSSGNAFLTLGNTASSNLVLEMCSLILDNTGSISKIVLGNASGVRITLIGCTYTFGSHTGQTFTSIAGNIDCNISGGIINVGANVPTILFTSLPSILNIDGLDLSAFGSGKTLFGASAISCTAIMKNCKLGGSVTKSATPTTTNQKNVIIVSDSAATNYLHELYTYWGKQTVETTIVRTGGASDGTTPIAWKVDTTANSRWTTPFESMPIAIWNDTTASNVTVTVYGIWGGGAVPNNDDIWLEVSYMGSSATPLATINTANTKADALATNAAQSSDASSWGGSTTAFKMSVTLSSPQPGMKGYIYVTVKAAKVSSTFYIDPKVVLS